MSFWLASLFCFIVEYAIVWIYHSLCIYLLKDIQFGMIINSYYKHLHISFWVDISFQQIWIIT